MRDNCFRDDGTPRTITRATFELLRPGRIRWELWADVDVLNLSQVLTPAELPAAIETTRLLLGDTYGQETPQVEAAPCVQTDPVARGLG